MYYEQGFQHPHYLNVSNFWPFQLILESVRKCWLIIE